MLRRVVMLGLLASCITNFAFANAEDIDQTVLGDVKLIPAQSHKIFPKLHGNLPHVIFYYVSGAHDASCGITLGTAPSAPVLPILDIGPGDDYPSCLDVTDALPFAYDGTQNYVFKYVQKDSAQSNSTGYYFARKIGNQLFALGDLNGGEPPHTASIEAVAAWARNTLADER